MLTTDGATRRTAPVIAREYASSRTSSPAAVSGAFADSAPGLPCHAPDSDISDNGVAAAPAKTLLDSSRLMLDRCRSIYSGFKVARALLPAKCRRGKRDNAALRQKKGPNSARC